MSSANEFLRGEVERLQQEVDRLRRLTEQHETCGWCKGSGRMTAHRAVAGGWYRASYEPGTPERAFIAAIAATPRDPAPLAVWRDFLLERGTAVPPPSDWVVRGAAGAIT